MEREEILTEIRKYFNVKELVCPHTYEKWGEKSWQFLDTMYLWCLLVIRRDILKAPMTCNNGKDFTQRGLRCNCCQLVASKTRLAMLYLSSHLLGKAGDFTVKGMTAEQARQKIIENADLLPCNIRMEKGVSWLHWDTLPQYGVTDKVYLFKA